MKESWARILVEEGGTRIIKGRTRIIIEGEGLRIEVGGTRIIEEKGQIIE